ncbi:MAG: TIGR03067 domain-containing protein [Planctomycetaceae bacterium]
MSVQHPARFLVLCGLAFATVVNRLPADESVPASSDKDTERIVGVWRVISIEIDGQPTPRDDARKLSIVNEPNGIWTLKSEDQTDIICRGTSTFQMGATPRQIDFRATAGSLEGMTFHGIYELDQNSRKLCFTSTELPRPTDFTSFPGTKRYLLELERVTTP